MTILLSLQIPVPMRIPGPGSLLCFRTGGYHLPVPGFRGTKPAVKAQGQRFWGHPGIAATSLKPVPAQRMLLWPCRLLLLPGAWSLSTHGSHGAVATGA